MNIISGALDFKQKTVVSYIISNLRKTYKSNDTEIYTFVIPLQKDIMTKLDSVFMLPIETILDFDTVSEILAQGKILVPLLMSLMTQQC